MQCAAELRVHRVVWAGSAQARQPGGVQRPHHGGSLQRSLRHHAWHSGHAGQIACDHRQLEVLVNAFDAAIGRLPDPANCLAPTEMLLDTFADDLARSAARVPRGAPVNCAAAVALIVARDMRRHIASPAVVHEVARVVSLVSAYCLCMATRHAVKQPQCARALRETVRMTDHGTHYQPRAVLHQDVPVVAQDGWTLFALLEQTCIRIGARLMRIVAASRALPVRVGGPSSEPSFARKLL